MLQKTYLDYKRIYEVIDYTFKNKELLTTALTHGTAPPAPRPTPTWATPRPAHAAYRVTDNATSRRYTAKAPTGSR